jgi:hypothetical protein
MKENYIRIENFRMICLELPAFQVKIRWIKINVTALDQALIKYKTYTRYCTNDIIRAHHFYLVKDHKGSRCTFFH